VQTNIEVLTESPHADNGGESAARLTDRPQFHGTMRTAGLLYTDTNRQSLADATPSALSGQFVDVIAH
jgi:hypothetical protein